MSWFTFVSLEIIGILMNSASYNVSASTPTKFNIQLSSTILGCYADYYPKYRVMKDASTTSSSNTLRRVQHFVVLSAFPILGLNMVMNVIVRITHPQTHRMTVHWLVPAIQRKFAADQTVYLFSTLPIQFYQLRIVLSVVFVGHGIILYCLLRYFLLVL